MTERERQLERTVERLRERLEYRVNAHDGIVGPFLDAQSALLELGEHQQSWEDGGSPRPPELESRYVGPWTQGRFPPPSDSQGDQERCGGTRELVGPASEGNYPCPGCPDCNPAPAPQDAYEQSEEALIDRASTAPAPTQVEGDEPKVRKFCPQHGEVDQVGVRCNRPMGTRLSCGEELQIVTDPDPVPDQVEGDEGRLRCRRCGAPRKPSDTRCQSCTAVGQTFLGQPEGGDEEDWPEVEMYRLTGLPSKFNEIYKVDDGEGMPDDPAAYKTRRYVPAALPAAVPSEPSVLEEERDKYCGFYEVAEEHATFWEGVANKEKADKQELQTQLGRAETALEELAATFEEKAKIEQDGRGELWRIADAYEQAASLCREKAAALKGDSDAR